jgi:hypothetical protein
LNIINISIISFLNPSIKHYNIRDDGIIIHSIKEKQNKHKNTSHGPSLFTK